MRNPLFGNAPDEVHHAPAITFFSVLEIFAAKFRYGLSATPERRDGLEQMIYRSIGPAIAIIEKKEVENIGATVPTSIIPIITGFTPGYIESWNEYLTAIAVDAERNELIISLSQEPEAATIILVDRVSHAEQLSEMLERRNIDHVLAHGKVAKKDKDLMERIKSAKLTVGTCSLLGEGIDVGAWSVLVMGSPISSEIKLRQAIGRVVRPAPNKSKAIVYDLRDNCGFAGASWNKRFEIYKKNKIWVEFNRDKNAVHYGGKRH